MSDVFFSAKIIAFYPEDAYTSRDEWPEDAIKMTEDEKSKYWMVSPPEGKVLGEKNGRPAFVDPPAKSNDELSAIERAWRDYEIKSVSWLRDRHRDQLDLGGDTDISKKQFAELITYIQALRDWPESKEFPDSAKRPVAPEWLAEQIGK